MRIAALLLILGLLACNGDDGTPDSDPDGDADADADADPDLDSDYPPLDCGDHPDNWISCMLNWPDGGPEWGTMCDGRCRAACGPAAGGADCPGSMVCHASGAFGLCFEP